MQILSVCDKVDMSFIYKYKRCSSKVTSNYWGEKTQHSQADAEHEFF